MNVLDLFSGIGGFSLGLERAGMKTVAFCEIEEAARKRVGDGFSDYVDRRERTELLGNAVVPQIPDLIGRAFIAAEV